MTVHRSSVALDLGRALVDGGSVRIDLVLRATRRVAVLSQREVAARAGVAHSVVGRIEAGRAADPGIELVQRLLGATGHRLLVVDKHGRDLSVGHADDELVDRAGRRYPAHLALRPVRHWDLWWGWFRIAWWLDDPAVPAVTFNRRSRYGSWRWTPEPWDDAT